MFRDPRRYHLNKTYSCLIVPRESHFSDLWLTIPEYNGWLRKKNDTTAICKYCCKDINVSNMGEQALKSHMKGQKHKDRTPSNSIISHLQPASSSKSETFILPTSTQTTIKSVLIKDSILHAEIRWVLKIIESKHSQHLCEGTCELFAAMFPDSEIAQNLKLGRTKCGYYINHGIAPHFLQLLYEEINASPYYIISFDERLNKSLQRGQMDILVRYWNVDTNITTNIAQTRYLKSEFMGGAKAEQILKTFEDGITKQKPQEFLQISSAGRNVNLKFLKLFSEKRAFHELPPLVNIGTCGLHTIHGSMKAGAKKSRWNIGKTMKAMWKILDESPARRDVYESITESNIYPLPYCGHRWCENDNCANRAEIVWPGFVKFIKYLQGLVASKRPQRKSFTFLQESIKDPLLKAKFKFVEFIAEKLNTFLRGFQTDQPMVPFLCDTLKELLLSLMNMFILNQTMLKADTLIKVLKIDTSDSNVHKSPNNVDIGMAAQLHLREYKKRLNYKDSAVTKFQKEVCQFVTGLTGHMSHKCPLNYVIVRCASLLNPNVLAVRANYEHYISFFSNLVLQLVVLKQITTKVGGEAKQQ